MLALKGIGRRRGASETGSGFRRSYDTMTPVCPVCKKSMEEQGRVFQCEPCRQIIIFFTVSDVSPYTAPRHFTELLVPSVQPRL
jgi:tRNA(Ile2) C34 agmatinyltransferase TiaS